jgi:hypothetical protein
MCTVTVVPVAGGVRLACNRDEQRTRPAALPPTLMKAACRHALAPVDPAGGGTWVAVSDAGLLLVLLNVTVEPGVRPPGVPRQTRGAIIPALLSCDTLSDAIARALALGSADYAPFRLVIADSLELAELRSEGSGVCLVRREPLLVPRLFTSSGLGDRLVEGVRGSLFADLFTPGTNWVARQDDFHRHSWADRPQVSVCMRRPEARTVSLTVVLLEPDRASLVYHPDAPDRPAVPMVLELDLHPGELP